jgi:hypothetical protein
LLREAAFSIDPDFAGENGCCQLKQVLLRDQSGHGPSMTRGGEVVL